MMPMFWPSSSGKCTPPKSSTMWRMSALAFSLVRRKLPATVAVIGPFSL